MTRGSCRAEVSIQHMRDVRIGFCLASMAHPLSPRLVMLRQEQRESVTENRYVLRRLRRRPHNHTQLDGGAIRE